MIDPDTANLDVAQLEAIAEAAERDAAHVADEHLVLVAELDRRRTAARQAAEDAKVAAEHAKVAAIRAETAASAAAAAEKSALNAEISYNTTLGTAACKAVLARAIARAARAKADGAAS